MWSGEQWGKMDETGQRPCRIPGEDAFPEPLHIPSSINEHKSRRYNKLGKFVYNEQIETKMISPII